MVDRNQNHECEALDNGKMTKWSRSNDKMAVTPILGQNF